MNNGVLLKYENIVTRIFLTQNFANEINANYGMMHILCRPVYQFINSKVVLVHL